MLIGRVCVCVCVLAQYWPCPVLQYATGLSAVVIGKPSSSFFMSALQDLQVEPEEVKRGEKKTLQSVK